MDRILMMAVDFYPLDWGGHQRVRKTLGRLWEKRFRNKNRFGQRVTG